ncbi:MAG: HEAT repeat domain-containing protein [Planctomycetota bacterium]
MTLRAAPARLTTLLLTVLVAAGALSAQGQRFRGIGLWGPVGEGPLPGAFPFDEMKGPYMPTPEEMRKRLAAEERHWTAWWYMRGEDLMLEPAEGARTAVPTKLRAALEKEIRAAAKHPSPEVRRAAAFALGRAGMRADVELVRDLIRDEDRETRRLATLALGLVGDVGDYRFLRALAEASLSSIYTYDPQRAAAMLAGEELARRLGAAVPEKEVAKFRAVYRAALVIPREDGLDGVETTIAALAIHARRPDAEAGEAVRALAAHPKVDRWIRAAALRALGAGGGEFAEATLLDALDESAADLRAAALDGLALGRAHIGEEQRARLLRVVRGDPHMVPRILAAGVLTHRAPLESAEFIDRIGDASMVETIVWALAFGFERAPIWNADIPRRLAAALRPLVEQAKAPDVATAAGLALARLGYPEDRARLRARFDRGGAASMLGLYALALGAVGDEKARGVVRDLALDRGDLERRRDAILGLARLGGDETRLARLLDERQPARHLLGAVAQGFGLAPDAAAAAGALMSTEAFSGEEVEPVRHAFAIAAAGATLDAGEGRPYAVYRRGSWALRCSGFERELARLP